MTRPTIFIDGESGTTGLQIRARLARRDDLELVQIDPDRRKDPGERGRLLNAVDLAVLCLPDAAAREAASLIENPAVRVLDASSAHRTAPGWTYGFPELTAAQEAAIRAARRVSNPGCYAIGAIALLRPLVEAGVLPPSHPLMIHAVEGYSGGGRQLVESYEKAGPDQIQDPYRLYSFDLKHKHVPEIEAYGRLDCRPLFWPGYGKWLRGMLVQIPLHLRALPGSPTARDLREALAARYNKARFVDVKAADWRPAVLSPEGLNGTNQMALAVFGNDETGQALMVALADNLGKGASGSAAQNIDLMLGIDDGHDYALLEGVG